MLKKTSFLTKLLLLSSLGIINVSTAHAIESEPYVTVVMLTDKKVVAPGSSLLVGIELKMDNQWHTYWKNPGDIGYATRVIWDLPPKITSSELGWPPPQRFKVGDLVNYGYDDTAVLLYTLDFPEDTDYKNVLIKTRVEWLACKEICIPGEIDLEKLVTVGQENIVDENNFAKLSAAQNIIPSKIQPGRVRSSVTDTFINITIPRTLAPKLHKLMFFPDINSDINLSSPQQLSSHDSHWTLKLSRKKDKLKREKPLRGVLIADPEFYDGSKSKAIGYDFDQEIVPPALGNIDEKKESALLYVLLLAIAGGFLLNLMPCVFPVISIKLLSFIRQDSTNQKSIRTEGFLFALGIVTCFMFLFGLIETLSFYGKEVGWGFQLQSPNIIAGLILLFFALALNLLSVFEFGTSVQSLAGEVITKKKYWGTYLSGLVATLVAAPCTGPLLGVAMGISLTQDFTIKIMLFLGMAIGMAAPYILLGFYPMLGRKLPKPGPWMGILKRALAFPLFLTVIWLIWVFGNQTNFDTVINLLVATCFFGVALAVYGELQKSNRSQMLKKFVAAFFAFAALTIIFPVKLTTSVSKANYKNHWETWDPEIVHSSTNQPIFIDFTAAWCITCQYNKKTVLESESVINLFLKHNFLLMRADWTNHDPRINVALRSLGRRGVPVYVIYGSGNKIPMVLPEILTKEIIIKAIRQANL